MAWETVAEAKSQADSRWETVATGRPVGETAIQPQEDSFDFTSPKDYGRAVEGMGIASGITEDISAKQNPATGEPITRAENIVGEVGEGLGNLYDGSLTGMNQMAADIAGLVGLDSVDELYSALADKRRGSIQERSGDNSAAGAVGEELGGMAVVAPIGGKATDLLLGGGKMAKNLVGRRIDKLAGKEGSRLLDIAKKSELRLKEGLDMSPAISEFSKLAVPKPPAISLVTEGISKVSPTTAKVIDKYWAKLLAPMSQKAAFKVQHDAVQALRATGLSQAEANLAYKRMVVEAGRYGKTATEALLKTPSKTGSAVGALLGSQTQE